MMMMIICTVKIFEIRLENTCIPTASGNSRIKYDGFYIDRFTVNNLFRRFKRIRGFVWRLVSDETIRFFSISYPIERLIDPPVSRRSRCMRRLSHSFARLLFRITSGMVQCKCYMFTLIFIDFNLPAYHSTFCQIKHTLQFSRSPGTIIVWL